ncbi:DUF481 domain-containing protein [Stieleria marina]|uniref:Mucin-like protein n=1 Tax=Stieleria marina TaxID=1930275 RepID=A0A517NWJ2_9BACT|nr:hypothetical protein K239x_34760 [Planctomycetes bacterium K23_9]
MIEFLTLTTKSRWSTASSFAACSFAVCVIALLGQPSPAMGQNGETQPAWMGGTSTWTGDGYEVETTPKATLLPNNIDPASGPILNPYATGATKPYTTPVDPQAKKAAAVASELKTPLTGAASKIDSKFSQAIGAVAQAGAKTPETDSQDSSSVLAQVAHSQPLAGPIVGPIVGSGPLANPPGTPSMGQQIGAGINRDRPPLIEESIRWYQYPWRWMTQGWTNSIELGLDGSQGNAETLAIQTGAELKRKTDAYTLALDFDYRLVNNRDVVTEDNGRFNVDYDRLLGDSPWSLFGKFGLEWDEFKAFDLRLNLNSGVGYHWIRNDRTTFVTRFGAGASREIGAPDDDWVPEAVFGFDAEHQINKRNKFKAKLDYFPSWEDFGNYRIVSDASWEILLRDDESLSLKLAATDRYDSTPQGGNKANDVYYSLLLLMKF